MKKSITILMITCTAFVMAMSGCGKKNETVPEITPTPVPTAAPTPVPITATPLPTSTPAPRLIGVKTSQSKFIYLTNNTTANLREIYLRTSGSEEWGKNLIPSESSVKAAEQVQMHYTSGNTDKDTLYDMKVVTRTGEVYGIYSIPLGDMEKASFNVEGESAYLRYMSVSSKKEMNTKDSSLEDSSEDSYSSDYSEDDYSDWNESYYEYNPDDYDNDWNEDYSNYYDDNEYYYSDEPDDYYEDDYIEDYSDNDTYYEDEEY